MFMPLMQQVKEPIVSVSALLCILLDYGEQISSLIIKESKFRGDWIATLNAVFNPSCVLRILGVSM